MICSSAKWRGVAANHTDGYHGVVNVTQCCLFVNELLVIHTDTHTRVWWWLCRALAVEMSLRRRLLCCFNRKPQISYTEADNGGLQLVPMELAEPMPSDEAELDAKFAELVVRSFSFGQNVKVINRQRLPTPIGIIIKTSL